MPIVGLEPTYSRFLNALQDIFGIVEWNLWLNNLRHLPFVLKWTYSVSDIQFSKINLAAKTGSAPIRRVSKTLVLLLHYSAINSLLV